MEPIYKQTHLEIQDGLQRGIITAKNILTSLGLTNNYTHSQLEKLILEDLKNMNIDVKFASSLINQDIKQSVPAFIKLTNFDRNNGGTIKLNKKYSKKALVEALYHEYAHLKDDTLPIHISNLDAPNSRATFFTPYLRMVENRADMIAYTLMMPPEQIIKDLMETAFNIDFILSKYKYLETSTVLSWITIINPFPCHFMWLIVEKDTEDKPVRIIPHDNCSYDHQNNPRPFNIEPVLYNSNSALAEALREKKNVKKVSSVEGTEFYCCAYYESNLTKELIRDYLPYSSTINYDRLLVIGWTKQINDWIKQTYDAIQMMTKAKKL
jgi:hypothetical protein